MKDIIDLLKLDNYYGVSHTIDIAKGLYKIPYTRKDVKDKFIRIIKNK